MKNRILHLLTLLTSQFSEAAERVWEELPGHVTAAVIIEAAVSGDPAWTVTAGFLLVTLAILRR
jgi:hypothetical protein